MKNYSRKAAKKGRTAYRTPSVFRYRKTKEIIEKRVQARYNKVTVDKIGKTKKKLAPR